jgi:hypothetical protein
LESPRTQRKIIEDKILPNVEKLGPVATYFTLIKGFICTGCLYLPKSAFVNGGWFFALLSMTLSGFLT